MSRADRLRAWLSSGPPTSQRGVSTVSAVTCLYREWRVMGRELERLSQCLTRGHFHEGLRALERACSSLRIAEGLVEVVARDQNADLVAASLLRRELLAEIRPWIEAARRELPSAAATLCKLAPDPASAQAVVAALRQLEEPLDGDPAGELPKRRTGS
jgi:hypothetical protein